ncbi:MAG: hypothetical protein SCARUB_04935 [Candidatus Scalindua rubra]|uniref:Uncharacterized protein n=1 Tax=Candidatus Scalindua rubra TaxID=1872076 RepID=A0A1E3X2V2_9BACT|nr:MAG: hypothetical protein SCARUB_04935 [Candidatus Scalindua rubra]
MYYNRIISDSFSKLIEPNGELRWLFDLVKQHEDLDFLIGKNKSKEWISIYRGLSRMLTIIKTKDNDIVKLDGANSYKEISPVLYGKKLISVNFSSEFKKLVQKVSNNPKFDRYYNNKKEGYYQNELSRKFGICGKPNDEFVIIDKEAVIGHINKDERKKILGEIQTGYKKIQKEISKKDSKRYGKNLDKKSIGNELDFIALDKSGNLLLMELKHGTNTSGIYLSPLQIGMYYDIFTMYPKVELENAVYEMIEQKKKIGLIIKDWVTPTISGIIPVLIISEYNYRSSAKSKYQEVLDFVRVKKGSDFLKNIVTYNYSSQKGLGNW